MHKTGAKVNNKVQAWLCWSQIFTLRNYFFINIFPVPYSYTDNYAGNCCALHNSWSGDWRWSVNRYGRHSIILYVLVWKTIRQKHATPADRVEDGLNAVGLPICKNIIRRPSNIVIDSVGLLAAQTKGSVQVLYKHFRGGGGPEFGKTCLYNT